MIEFKAKKMALAAHGYCITLPGNGGEEMLAIFMAWGQDHKTNLVIVSATVDGGVVVLHSSGKRLILANVLAVIYRTIEKWSATGVKPDAEAKARLAKQRDKVCDRIANYYDTGVL